MSDEDSWAFGADVPVGREPRDESWGFGSGVDSGEGPAPGSASGSAPGSALGLASGTAFGPFDLLDGLGDGAFGVVFRARERESKREVALKILTKVQEQQRRRFRREGELTAALTHPGIVKIHSAGEVEGLPYLAYELIEGGRTFAHLMREEPQRGLAVLAEVARAVAYAHAQGVVHRDLKPTNVLVDAEGRARVADFGLAYSEGVDALTRSGALVGTPTHMSPEQFAGSAERVGPTSDVWALGVMLYRCLTGELPFTGANLVQLAQAIEYGDLRAPSSIDPRVSKALEAVCRKALEREPELRYPDARMFSLDLANAMEDRPVSASHASWSGALGQRWKGARRARFGTGVVALAACLGALVVGLWGPPRPGAPPERLQEALWALRAGRGDLAHVAALASEVGSLEPALSSEAHLALSLEADLALSERLAHARAALALAAPEQVRSSALRLAGVAWEQGEAQASLEAYAQARRSGELPLAERLAEAEVRLCEGQPSGALALAATCLSEARGEQRTRALALTASAKIASGAVHTAREQIDDLRSLAPLDAAVLSAQAALAAGVDPEQAWGKEHAAHEPFALARGRQLLAGGEPHSARAALALAHTSRSVLPRDPRQPRAREVARWLDELLAEPPQVAAWRTAPPDWRRLAARTLIALAQREVAALERAAQPWRRTPPGALSAAARRARGLAAARAALELPELEPALRGEAHALAYTLGGDAGDLSAAAALAPQAPRVRWAQAGRALAEGQPARVRELLAGLPPTGRVLKLRAQGLLASGVTPETAPLEGLWAASRGTDVEVSRLLARAYSQIGALDSATRMKESSELLAGRERAAAAKLLEGALLLKSERRAGRDELLGEVSAALALDPLHFEARGVLARLRYAEASDTRHLRELLWGAAQDTRLLTDAWRDLLQLSRGLNGARYLTRVAENYPLRDAEDRWGVALIRTCAIEYEGQRAWLLPTLRALEAFLREDPADMLARTARALLLLRLGKDAEVAAEQRWLAEAIPDVALVGFLDLVLRARRGERPAELRERVIALREAGFRVWRAPGWTIRNYPALQRYAYGEGFKDLLGAADRR